MHPILKAARNLVILATLSACATTGKIDRVVKETFQPLVASSQPKEKRYQSILVGIVTPSETKVIALGTLTDNGEAPTETTIFEIGSVTKGFLGLLLASDSIQGAIDLDASFDSTVPLKLPSYRGKKITWRHLAQHTSGLPRLPGSLKPANPLQPYLDYGASDLQSFLKGFKLSREPGRQSEYSNLGAGLVGYGLEQVHKKPFEQLLRESPLDDLEINDTRIHLSDEQISRTTPVFLNGDPVELWQWSENSVLKGAGALRSTMHDMLILLQAMMGLKDQAQMPTISRATDPRLEAGENSQLGLFWNRLKAENIIWHNGGTYGSTTFIGYDPDRLVGIVVLSNSQIIDENGIDPRLDLAAITALQEVAPAHGNHHPE